VDALKKAWFMLKSKPGMMAVGTSQITLSSLSDRWFFTTSKKLLEGSFKYPNLRRVLINKPDGRKRPLAVANPRIKIIERAFLKAIEPFF